jgi:hypothetical protein
MHCATVAKPASLKSGVCETNRKSHSCRRREEGSTRSLLVRLCCVDRLDIMPAHSAPAREVTCVETRKPIACSDDARYGFVTPSVRKQAFLK